MVNILSYLNPIIFGNDSGLPSCNKFPPTFSSHGLTMAKGSFLQIAREGRGDRGNRESGKSGGESPAEIHIPVPTITRGIDLF